MNKATSDHESKKTSYDIANQKVLVTGASGFLGSHLCDCLCKKGVEVHAVSRISRSSDAKSLRWWQHDLENIESVRDLFRNVKPEVIFHLSGYTTGSTSLDLVLPTFHSLLVSTINLLTVAAETGCHRIILMASLEEPQPAYTEVTPASPYAAAKWASSAYGRMLHKLYQVPVVLARPFMTYGPGQNIHKIIPSAILSLLQGQTPKLASGKRAVDWIYVKDVIEGLLTMVSIPDLEGCTIDLGSGTLVSIREVVNQLVNIANPSIQPSFGALPDRPVEQVRVADTALAYTKLGWQPTTSLKNGLEQTVDWYRERLRSSPKEVEDLFKLQV
jgi:UDP-glucose 4-epimerase